MHGAREQNYWPGFVDALSNLVLTLIFLIVIFVFALVISAGEADKAMKQVKSAEQAVEGQKQAQEQPTPETLTKENEVLREQLTQAEAKIEQLSSAATTASLPALDMDAKKEIDVDPAQKTPEVKSAKSIGLQVAGDRIVINYPLSIADLDDKSKQALEQAIDGFKPRFKGQKITIQSVRGGEPFSAAERYAYYRAITIRNILLSKDITDGGKIATLMASSPVTEGGRVEVIFGR